MSQLQKSGTAPDAPETAKLLRAAITRSGLSDRRFAGVMGRDERTIRQWLAGGKMTAAAETWLRNYLEQPDLPGESGGA